MNKLAYAALRSFDNKEIAARSPDSAAMMPYWTLVGDIVTGKEAITARGKEYLPQFVNELDKDYNLRLKLAKFTNIYRDVLENLASKPFEKEVTLQDAGDDAAPEQIRTFLEDVDGSGNNLTVFAADTFYKGMNYAVEWIFVDYPTTDGTVRTVADEKAAGIRPIWSHVLGMNVLEAKSQVIGGKEVWTLIRIWEPGTPNKVRVMKRDLTGATFEVWREEKKENSTEPNYVMESTGPITIGEIPMVAFITGRRDGKRYFFFPMMRDAADMQIELYQQESGNKFIRTLTCYPMLSANGVRPEMDADGKPKPVPVSPLTVLYAPPDGKGNSGSWGFIQPEAGLMNYLKDDVKETIAQLRELGRQPLTAQSGNLTVITTAVAAGKARSAVGAAALGLKNALENALVLTAKWMKIEYDPEVNVYTEFDDFVDNGADVAALGTMRAGGDISRETYWSEMKRRGVLSDDFDADDETERLLNELPGDDEELDADGNPIDKVPPAI